MGSSPHYRRHIGDATAFKASTHRMSYTLKAKWISISGKRYPFLFPKGRFERIDKTTVWASDSDIRKGKSTTTQRDEPVLLHTLLSEDEAPRTLGSMQFIINCSR